MEKANRRAESPLVINWTRRHLDTHTRSPSSTFELSPLAARRALDVIGARWHLTQSDQKVGFLLQETRGRLQLFSSN